MNTVENILRQENKEMWEEWGDDFEELPVSAESQEIQKRLYEVDHDVFGHEWLESEIVPWEEKMWDVEEVVRQYRKKFLDVMSYSRVAKEVRVDNTKRWLRGEFDSVTAKELVIGTTWITHGKILPKSNRRVFQDTPGQIEEIDSASPDSGVGRSSMTIRQWTQLRWEPSVRDDSVLAVREKLDGSRFVKVERNGKFYLSGFKEIEVSKKFPATVVEYLAGRFYAIYPYGVESGTYDQVRLDAHPWKCPQNLKRTISSDGVMVLTMRGEYRVKDMLTADVEVKDQLVFGTFPCKVSDGVWEVALSGEGNLQVLVPLRPRPGKRAVQSFRDVYTQVITRDIKIPPLYWEVKNVKTSIAVEVKGKRVFIGQIGEKVSETADILLHKRVGELYHYKLKDLKGEYTMVLRQPITDRIIAAPEKDRSVTGAKWAILSSDGTWKFVRENKKSYDLYGGKIEYGETPEEAARREYREETGYDPLFQIFLGVHSHNESSFHYDCYYTSYIFLTYDTRDFGLSVKYPFAPSALTVSWLDRHIQFISSFLLTDLIMLLGLHEKSCRKKIILTKNSTRMAKLIALFFDQKTGEPSFSQGIKNMVYQLKYTRMVDLDRTLRNLGISTTLVRRMISNNELYVMGDVVFALDAVFDTSKGRTPTSTRMKEIMLCSQDVPTEVVDLICYMAYSPQKKIDSSCEWSELFGET